MSLITDELKQELTRLYNAPDRFYHGLGHVNALLALLEQYRREFVDPEAIEAAIWYHDCIYDTRAHDNEHQSAELAVTHLSPICKTDSDRKRLCQIRDLIEATATHTLPQAPEPELSTLSDIALFLDMDLSILGSKDEEFDAYEAAVRKEYGWVSEEAWCTGRANVLVKFAQRPRIFFSDLFRDEYEDKARRNIERSLKRLRSSRPPGTT